jgi:hypothetical protein
MRRAVIDELDRQEAVEMGPGQTRRRHRRIAYPSAAPVPLEVQRHGEGFAPFLAAPRDISSSGVSLLIGMFMHPGADCAVTLKTLEGEPVRLGAVIRRCRFVSLKLHELGVRFNKEIDLTRFVHKPEDGKVDWARALESPRAVIAIKASGLLEALRNGARKAEVQAAIKAMDAYCGAWVE